MALLELGLLAMAAGTGLSAYSQYKQGKFAAKLHKFNRAAALRYSKTIKELRTYEQGLFLRQARKVLPAQKTKIAAAGLEISGTPLDVLSETKQILDERSRLMEFERDIEVERIRTGAAISGFRADIARTAGRTGAFATLLTGGGQLALAGYQTGLIGGTTNA